jgi:sporulation protein YlmC with PRC-barrel domain
VIINPVGKRVTHVVVKDKKRPHAERLVNTKWLAETTDELIRLSCTKAELANMKPFVETQFLDESLPDYDGFVESEYFLWPYRVPEMKVHVKAKHKGILPGELAIRRSARVHCTDGAIGRVDEFLVDPADGHITHMILRKGHLWGERDVAVSVSEIVRIKEQDVFLSLSKKAVEALPGIPMQPVARVEVEAAAFPIGANVHCTDGACGESSCVIFNPVSQKVTHLVVKDRKYPHTERLVPAKWVKETDDDLIRLSCTSDAVRKMMSFHETHFLHQKVEETGYVGEGFLLWPYRVPVTKKVRVHDRRIPPGELAIRRGARVHCTDGRIGKVDEFLLDPADGKITHLVLRKGHLWGERDVTVPLSQIRNIEEEAVYLKLDKRSVEALPIVAVRRP